MKKPYVLMILLMLFLGSCGYPGIVLKPRKPVDIKLEIVELPEKAKRGEETIFKLETIPQNKCIGGIGYWSIERDKWTTIKFPDITANDDGICQWNWIVPSDVKMGYAEFRTAIYQGGESKGLIPYNFCIEECPDPTPTDQGKRK